MEQPTLPFELRRVLYPTDFSDEAETAFGYTACLADTLKARLIVCYCPAHPWWKNEVISAIEIEKIHRKVKALLVRSFGSVDRLKWESLVLKDEGVLATAISEVATQSRCDLIVMKTGRPKFFSCFVRSTAEQVIKKSICPVILLPPDYLANYRISNFYFKPQRILVNYDFTPLSEEILRSALTIVKAFKSEIHLLHVVSNSEKMTTELGINSIGRKTLENILLEKLKGIIPDNLLESNLVNHTVQIGNIQKEILKYSKKSGIDLICTPVPQPKFRLKASFSSWIERLLRCSNCPLMVKN